MTERTPDTSATQNGAHLLAQTLHRFGVRQVFHIPGEGILEPLDALAQTPGMQLTTCRHEAGMAYAAQGYARRVVAGTAQQPGVCLAARAPAALNTALALHTADTDAVPLLLIIGQAALIDAGGDPLAGFDLGEVFKPLVKAVLSVTSADRIPETLSQAWHTATSARMGPVVVIVPENVWQQHSAAPVLDAPSCAQPAPSSAALTDFQALSQNAQRPLLMVGGSGWRTQDLQALRDFARHSQWPVACAYRRADLLDHDDPHFVGEIGIGADAALLKAVAQADLIVVLNMRLGEINTFGSSGGFGGWRLFERPRPQQCVVHVHADVRELQRNYQVDLALPSAPGAFLQAAQNITSPLTQNDWLTTLRQTRLGFVNGGQPCPGPLDVRSVMHTLRQQLPRDCPVCVGAGAYAVWLHRYFSLHQPHTLFGPKSGAMGYGLAAAIGAARANGFHANPGQPVLALAGDGCLQMHGEELATAVQYQLPILLVVLNNAAYAAIESTQKHLFGRATGTRLTRVDFAAWAQSLGASGLTVRDTAAFASALAQALKKLADGPVVMDLHTADALGKPL